MCGKGAGPKSFEIEVHYSWGVVGPACSLLCSSEFACKIVSRNSTKGVDLRTMQIGYAVTSCNRWFPTVN